MMQLFKIRLQPLHKFRDTKILHVAFVLLLIVMMLVRRNQNRRQHMNNPFGNGYICYSNRRSLIDCDQGQAMEVADIDNDRFVIQSCRKFILYMSRQSVPWTSKVELHENNKKKRRGRQSYMFLSDDTILVITVAGFGYIICICKDDVAWNSMILEQSLEILCACRTEQERIDPRRKPGKCIV